MGSSEMGRMAAQCVMMVISLAASATSISAQESSMPLNIPLPTLGGVQFWTDHRYWHGWRLQQNALVDHWRIIDDRAFLRYQGTRDACEQYLVDVIRTRNWPTPAQRIVMLLHGLSRSRRSMKPLAEPISEAGCGDPISFEYASTRRSIDDHARALRGLLRGLPGQPRIDLVGHSLGNIVSRRLFADLADPESGDAELLGRIDHCVMLGPPNNGSRLATRLETLGLFTLVMGESASELASGWTETQARLAIPPCPFGIIAGNMQEGYLRNPYLPQASDLIVTVDETRLPGATDFLEVPVIHAFLMQSEVVQKAVVQFLQHSSFQPRLLESHSQHH
jgi:pimeloyl-ACP methyl ester carboxylesterase